MSDAGQTPPGWYPDASGQTRWWDGSRWTEHTAEGQPQAGWGGAVWQPRHYLAGAGSDFGDAISNAFKYAFEYRGRASRSSFWWFALAQFLFGIGLYVALLIALVALSSDSALGDIVGVLVLLALVAAYVYLFLVSLSLSVRRLHDTDKSGWWYLLSLVPIAGIVLIVFWVMEPTPHRNQYDLPETAA